MGVYIYILNMAIKDYYEILEIPPGASGTLIKKAYRKLAMRYHPDKNVGNPYAAHHFREIQEAYEVLSNPVKRNEYHLKRWQYSEPGRTFNSSYEVSPALLLQEATKLANQVKGLDVFRMNRLALRTQLEQLLLEDHINLLLDQTEPKLNGQMVKILQPVALLLPYPDYYNICKKLLRLAGDKKELIELLEQTSHSKKQQYLWDKYKGLLMIVIALILCYLIYRIA